MYFSCLTVAQSAFSLLLILPIAITLHTFKLKLSLCWKCQHSCFTLHFLSSKRGSADTSGESLAPIGQGLEHGRLGTRVKPSTSVRALGIGSEGSVPCFSAVFQVQPFQRGLDFWIRWPRLLLLLLPLLFLHLPSSPSLIPSFIVPNTTSTGSSSCIYACYSQTPSCIGTRRRTIKGNGLEGRSFAAEAESSTEAAEHDGAMAAKGPEGRPLVKGGGRPLPVRWVNRTKACRQG